MRKYAEFFADFVAQENELLTVDSHFLACSIIAFTRKHLNLSVIWPKEMEMLTFCKLANITKIFELIAQKYNESFPDHASNQERLVRNRQRMQQSPPPAPKKTTVTRTDDQPNLELKLTAKKQADEL